MAIGRYPNFDRIVFLYDFLKTLVFGKSIENAQVAFLSKIPQNTSVLIIGGGTGKLLMEVATLQNVNSITYLELSGKMINAARRRMSKYSDKAVLVPKIEFIQGSVEALDPTIKFNVIFTPFVLDVVEENDLPAFMGIISQVLQPNGLWFFSDFQISSAPGFKRWYQRNLTKMMLNFFSITAGLNIKELPNFDLHFIDLGYKVHCSELFYNGFIQSKVWIRDKK